MNEVKVITTYSQGEYFAVVWQDTFNCYMTGLFDQQGKKINGNAYVSDCLIMAKHWCRDQLRIYNEPNEP